MRLQSSLVVAGILRRAAVAALLGPLTAAGATVSYHGLLKDPTPPQGDFVIAGTFRPGFQPWQYSHIYGDAYGNLDFNHHYSHAIADENWRPIGVGTLADASGAFSGSGTTTGIDGLPIYLFLFDNPNPDTTWFFALATSTNPLWSVQNDGDIIIDAARANQFTYGYKQGDRIALSVIPFPEPSSAIAVAVMTFALLRRRTCE
jgi:hypothetical protein